MFRAILLELFLPFKLFKKTANIRWTTTSAQILHESNRKWRLPSKAKLGAVAKQLWAGTSYMIPIVNR